jgi:hypothetical protein
MNCNDTKLANSALKSPINATRIKYIGNAGIDASSEREKQRPSVQTGKKKKIETPKEQIFFR